MLENGISGLDTIIIGCVSAFGGYLGAYLKKSAEISSMSDNIKELMSQQKKITEATESVKQDIEHQVWRKKEQELLKREKMEEFATLCLDLPQKLSEEYAKRSIDINADFDRHHLKKFMLIQRLYLPNFEEDMEKLISLHEKYEAVVLDVQKNPNPTHSYLSSKLPEFNKVRTQLEVFSATVVGKVGNEIESMGHA
ncbi:hypothetical protein BCU00_019875 [Vibrio breoganii]|uniref:hypothetical protein n=1 Tax=Vibrio breoganii TaxID=553239 RepID=UPI000C822268|nr:hypothetical protein [Vibrio breoganii]PMK41677.1 hypothetical protein BCU00_13755 [Vibrio breoganii]